MSHRRQALVNLDRVDFGPILAEAERLLATVRDFSECVRDGEIIGQAGRQLYLAIGNAWVKLKQLLAAAGLTSPSSQYSNQQKAMAVRALQDVVRCLDDPRGFDHEQLGRHLTIAVTALGKAAPAKANDPAASEGPFLALSKKQRMLVETLRDKGNVPIPVVVKAVYPTHRDPTEALKQLITRTNQKLIEKVFNLEIKRKGQTLCLTPI
jgi:hypothetical protein